MAAGKEIRTKIKSVENTRKITKAMEMVAASKMRKAQERMKAARPYAEKIARVATHLAYAHTEYKHPFVIARDNVKRVGLIVISSDKGLCGGLNTNAFRMMVNQMKQWEAAGVGIDVTAIGNKGLGFVQRLGSNVVSQLTGLGDTPHMEKLIGPVKIMLDAYLDGKIDALYIVYNRFINTMKQEPTLTQLLPLKQMEDAEEASLKTHWDYIYEPDAKPVVDGMLMRYIESLVYQRLDVAHQHAVDHRLGVGLVDVVPMRFQAGFLGVFHLLQRQQLGQRRFLFHRVDETVVDDVERVDFAVQIGIQHDLHGADQLLHVRRVAESGELRHHIGTQTLHEAQPLVADRGDVDANASGFPLLHLVDHHAEGVGIETAAQALVR